jgi:hypothetical protein
MFFSEEQSLTSINYEENESNYFIYDVNNKNNKNVNININTSTTGEKIPEPSLIDESSFVFKGIVEHISVSITVTEVIQLREEILKICNLLSVAAVVSEDKEFRFDCVRRCDLTMTTVCFHIEIFQTPDQNKLHVRFLYIDGSYEYFQRTYHMINKILTSDNIDENLQRVIFNKDILVLHPYESKLTHFGEYISTDCKSYYKVHPGVSEPLSIDKVEQEWSMLKNYFQNMMLSGLDGAISLALKGTPVPSEFIEFVMNSYMNKFTLDANGFTIELLGFLVAAITCNPLRKYENPNGSQYLLQIDPITLGKIIEVITSTLNKGELCKRHALRFLYAAAVRLPTYTELFNNDSVRTFLNEVIHDSSWDSNKMFSKKIIEILNEDM